MIRVIMRSPYTGMNNSMDLPITVDEIARWKNGELIQDVWPDLTRDECEFLKTGYTPEDWKAMFKKEEQ